MKQAEFETLLKQSLHTQPEEAPPAQLLPLAASQARRRHRRKRISFRQFLRKQVRYMGWPIWGSQCVFLLLFDRMLTQLYGERFWDSPSSVARLLFCVSTLVAMMALPLLYRSVNYRMQEIESASWFSAPRLLMAKLAVIGLGDLLLLSGMFLTTLLRTSMQVGNLSFCLLLPFLLLSAVFLFLMGHCSGSRFWMGSISAGAALLLLAAGLPGRWLPQELNPGWLALCIALLVFSAGQLRYLLYRSPYAELQLG